MSRAKGNIAEAKAVAYLQENGYLIVEQNFYSRFGEIDIIAAKNSVVHFVEVKSGDDYEKAIQNITRSKLAKLLNNNNIKLSELIRKNKDRYNLQALKNILPNI